MIIHPSPEEKKILKEIDEIRALNEDSYEYFERYDKRDKKSLLKERYKELDRLASKNNRAAVDEFLARKGATKLPYVQPKNDAPTVRPKKG